MTLCDERSKASLTGLTEVPLCECVALPARMAGWGWGPACSKRCLCFTIWNKSYCDKPELKNSLLLWNLKQWHRPVVITRITNINFLVLPYYCQQLQGVSTVSALWFISRHTGMHRWLCFVVSRSAFHRGGKWPHVLSATQEILMNYSWSVSSLLI